MTPLPTARPLSARVFLLDRGDFETAMVAVPPAWRAVALVACYVAVAQDPPGTLPADPRHLAALLSVEWRQWPAAAVAIDAVFTERVGDRVRCPWLAASCARQNARSAAQADRRRGKAGGNQYTAARPVDGRPPQPERFPDATAAQPERFPDATTVAQNRYHGSTKPLPRKHSGSAAEALRLQPEGSQLSARAREGGRGGDPGATPPLKGGGSPVPPTGAPEGGAVSWPLPGETAPVGRLFASVPLPSPGAGSKP